MINMTDIYYFSGTGNSLFAARRLGSLLGDARVLPVGPAVRAGKADIQAERLIIVFPVYFQTVPRIVRQFVRMMECPPKLKSIYAVATCNKGPGHALFTLRSLLKQKGLRLAAGFTVDMPGNALILRDMTNPPEVRELRLAQAEGRLHEIVEYIQSGQTGRIDGSNALKSHLRGFVTGTAATRVYRTPRRFVVTENCINCGACAKMCPVGNIIMDVEGPKWGGDCEQCLACFHWCPKGAVEIGGFTKGRLRYHHPEVTINDMFN